MCYIIIPIIIIIKRTVFAFFGHPHHELPIQHAVLRIIKNNIVGHVAVVKYTPCI